MALFSVFSFVMSVLIVHCAEPIYDKLKCIKYDSAASPVNELTALYLQKRNRRIRLMADGKPFNMNFSLDTYGAILFNMNQKFHTLRFSNNSVHYQCEFELIRKSSFGKKVVCSENVTLPRNDFCVPTADDDFSCSDEVALRNRIRYDGHRFFDTETCKYINEFNYSTLCAEEWTKDPEGLMAWLYDPVIGRAFFVNEAKHNDEFLTPQFSVACNIFAQSKSSFGGDGQSAKVLVWYAADIQNGREFIKLDPKNATCLLVDGFDFQAWHKFSRYFQKPVKQGKCKRMYFNKMPKSAHDEIAESDDFEDGFFLFAIILSPFLSLGFFLLAVLLNLRYLKEQLQLSTRQDNKLKQVSISKPGSKPLEQEKQAPQKAKVTKKKSRVVEKPAGPP